MKSHTSPVFPILIILSLGFGACNGKAKRQTDNSVKPVKADELSSLEALGKLLFFEEALSDPPGQSCSSCHEPDFAFAGPETGLPVSRGASEKLFGNRNDMPVSYAAYIPPLQQDHDGQWFGGLFWDGRAGNLREQAMGPPLNPLEMANPGTLTLAEKLRKLEYANKFEVVFGKDALADPGTAIRHMATAIEAYEKTREVSPFSSKYDFYLKGQTSLTELETQGLYLFAAENKGNCASCHPHMPGADGSPPLFSDFTYDNLGIPKNPENPFYLLPKHLNPVGWDYIDLGLGTVVQDPLQNGKFRVPTLRNVSITGPYMHNGYFKTLFQVMAFYNSRDLGSWPDPEVRENLNFDELGALGLTVGEMEAIVAFLHTLTDGWSPRD